MNKKLNKFLLSAFLVMLITSAIGFTGLAANEKEPNNGTNKATVIATDATHSGKLSSDEDVDWYKFTNDKDYFKLTFSVDSSVDYAHIGYGWNLTIYTSDGKKVIKSYSDITSGFTTPILPFKGTFFIKVECTHPIDAPVNCIYKLKVATTASDTWESEFNNDSAKADSIKAGKSYLGHLYKDADVDWYVVETKTGAFYFNFNLHSSVSYDNIGYGWKVSVYPYGSTKAIVTYSDVQSNLKSADIPYKGKFLVKVEAEHIIDAPIDCIYSLKVTQHSTSKVWETEKNDSKSKSTALKLGQSCYANIDRTADVDYFKYQAPAYGDVKLTFIRSVSDEIGYGWKITVTNEKGKALLEKGEITDSTFRKNGIKVKKGETVYIRVEAEHEVSAPVFVNYKLGVSFTAKTDNVTSFKAAPSQTAIKLSWKAVSGAEGYKIYTYSTKTKKYKLIKTTKKTALTIKELKAGTKYTYYIKAYQTYKGEQILSAKYTKLATATMCKTPTLKVTSTKKGVAALTWTNVAGETGYQVYGSSKKDSGYKKITTTKVNVAKASKNKLKSKKTYYFKVRAYTKTDSGTVYGAWSAVKSVKVK